MVFPDFSLTFPVCSKFPDFSLTGKCLPIFPGFPVFPVRVGTLQENTKSKTLVKLEEIDEEQWSNICSNLDDPTSSTVRAVRVKTEKNNIHENTNSDFGTVGSVVTKTNTVSPQSMTQIKAEANNSSESTNSDFGLLASNTTISPQNIIIVKQPDQCDGTLNVNPKVGMNSVVWRPSPASDTAPENKILTMGDGKIFITVTSVPSTICSAPPVSVNSAVAPSLIIQQPATKNLIGNNVKLPIVRQNPRTVLDSAKRKQYPVAKLDPIVKKCIESTESDHSDSKSDQLDYKSDQLDLVDEEEIKPAPQQLILTIDNEKIIVPNSGQVLMPPKVPIKTENGLPIPGTCVKQENGAKTVTAQSTPTFMPHKSWNGVGAVKTESEVTITKPKFKKGPRKRKLLSHKSWNGLGTCDPDNETQQITTTVSVKRPDEWGGEEVTDVMCVRCREIFQSMDKLNDHFKKTKHGDVNTYLFSTERWREVVRKKKQEILESCQGNAWICPTPKHLSLGPTIPEQRIPKMVLKCKECGGIYETEHEFFTHKTTQNKNACSYRQRLQENLLQNYESKPVDKALKPLI